MNNEFEVENAEHPYGAPHELIFYSKFRLSDLGAEGMIDERDII